MLRSAQHFDTHPRENTESIRRPTAFPAGPAWFGSVMGTSLLASLVRAHGIPVLDVVLCLTAWALLVLISVGFLARCIRRPRVLMDSLSRHSEISAWGMVSMGYLSVGSATSAVIPHWIPQLEATAWSVDWVLWIIGTAIGWVSAVGFGAKLMKIHNERPLPAWGLPMVAPMVTATTGAQLVAHAASPHGAILAGLLSVGSFFVALAMGVAVFGVAYEHAWRHEGLPPAAAASSFIPLGIVGQSTAAAQSLAMAAAPFVRPETGSVLSDFAHIYGVIVLCIGIPVFAWAAATTYRQFLRGMPFSPGWWAMTFPVGTCSLGTHLMGWDLLSLALLLVLAVHWCIAATGSVTNLTRALVTARPVRPSR
ncbi:MAG: TDT family transporter [Kocuria sp.]|nr:TDT family transporter [Kocuria sp.]